MAIILPNGLTTQGIRVLQEYRRLNAEMLTAEAISAIRHPAGGGEAPVVGLVRAGHLKVDESGAYSLTEKAREFLAIEATPEVGPTNQASASAAGSPAVQSV